MVGLLELNYFEKHKTRGYNELQPLAKNINDLNVELTHPSESIICAITKALSIQITGSFKPCEDCTLGKAKKQDVSKKGCSLFKNFNREALL